ncbi:MAG: hypothetical protein U0Q16_15130 [Bryobacteraceae bacterium]
MVDRQYCSNEHRKLAARSVSARVAREVDHLGGFDAGSDLEEIAPQKRPSSYGTALGIMLVVLATLLVMLVPSEQGGQILSKTADYLPPATVGSRLQSLIPSHGALSMREDFTADLRNWAPAGGSFSSWNKIGDSIQIGDLRLWRPTLGLRDYSVAFGTQIENRAVGWTFRASDSRNYYATKLSLTKQGGQITRAEIVRYAMVNGMQTSKVRLPIPLSAVDDSTMYEIKVGVRGTHYTTAVNGKMVDSWADGRLRKGGVGFFNDPGERAKLHWVSISERESFLRRFLSFGMILPAGVGASPEVMDSAAFFRSFDE